MNNLKVDIGMTSNPDVIHAMNLFKEFDKTREIHFPTIKVWLVLSVVLSLLCTTLIPETAVGRKLVILYIAAISIPMISSTLFTAIIGSIWCHHKSKKSLSKIINFLKEIVPEENIGDGKKYAIGCIKIIQEILENSTFKHEYEIRSPSFNFKMSDHFHAQDLLIDTPFFNKDRFPEELIGSRRYTTSPTTVELKLAYIDNICRLLSISPTVSYDLLADTIIVDC